MDDLIAALRKFAENLPAAMDLADLQAQQDMAYWAKWMFWATLASLAASILAVCGLFVSIRQTHRAIRDTREIGEMQVQAYVHITKATFGKFSPFVIHCKNTGQTPASHFGVRARTTLCTPGSVSSSIDMQSLDTVPWKLWTGLGAGEEQSVAVNVPDSSAVDAFPGEGQILLVYGQVLYCTVFNHDHVTDFAFYTDKASRGRFRKPTTNLRAYVRAPLIGSSLR